MDLNDLQFAFMTDEEFEAHCQAYVEPAGPMVAHLRRIRWAAQWEVRTREALIAALSAIAAPGAAAQYVEEHAALSSHVA